MRRQSSQPRAWGYLLPMLDDLPAFELRQAEASAGAERGCALALDARARGLAAGAAPRVLFRVARSDAQGRAQLHDCCGLLRVDGRALGRGRAAPLQHGARVAVGAADAFVFVDRATSDSFKAPAELLERYLVGQRLGEGGFGQVFLLFDKKNYQNRHAMKIVELSDDHERIFAKREAEILGSVKHPCVIQTFLVLRSGLQQFLVMEFLAGGDLSAFVNDKRPLSEAQSKLLFFQLALAVRYLHERNVCHRDLKPANILLQRREPRTLVKVTDFGLAKDEYAHSAMTTVAGTELYLAPEVMTERTYTKKVDVWSMGVMLFFSLTGALPFPHGMSEAIRHHHQVMYVTERWKNVSTAALQLVQRMLKVSALQRPTVAEVVDHPWMQDNAMRQDAFDLTGLAEIRPPPKEPARAAPAAPASPVRRAQNGPRGVLEYLQAKPRTAPGPQRPRAPAAANGLPAPQRAPAAPRPPPAKASPVGRPAGAARAPPRTTPQTPPQTPPAPPQRNAANVRRAQPLPGLAAAPLRAPHLVAHALAAPPAGARARSPGSPAARLRPPSPPRAGSAPPPHGRAQKTFLLDARKQLRPVQRE